MLLGGVLGDQLGIVMLLNVQGLGYGSAGVIVLIALRSVASAPWGASAAATQDTSIGRLTPDADVP